MKDEYIIINKTAIQKRIEELEQEVISEFSPGRRLWVDSAIKNLKEVLSQSTPLVPEIKKSWKDGRDGTKVVGSFPFIETHYINKTSQDYISNLKLDI